jgi:phosphomevalonate kinase
MVKDKDNVLRQLDEADNMVMVLFNAVNLGHKLDANEVKRRLNVIRKKLQFVTDRVQGS